MWPGVGGRLIVRLYIMTFGFCLLTLTLSVSVGWASSMMLLQWRDIRRVTSARTLLLMAPWCPFWRFLVTTYATCALELCNRVGLMDMKNFVRIFATYKAWSVVWVCQPLILDWMYPTTPVAACVTALHCSHSVVRWQPDWLRKSREWPRYVG